MMRAMDLIGVAEAATSLKCTDDAKTWLAEAEGMIERLPSIYQTQPRVELAAAWVLLDPAQTNRLLAARGGGPFEADMAIGRVLDRLIPVDPVAAIPWLDRFREPGALQADPYRGRVAVALAGRDLPQAVRIAEGIKSPAYRGATLARLATVAHPTDTRLAHDLVMRAADALAADPDPKAHDSVYRMGAAVYLVWQAEAVGYPDRTSIVAVALSARQAIPAGLHAARTRQTQTVRLAAVIAGVDPAAAPGSARPRPGITRLGRRHVR